MRILVTGSREWDDLTMIYQAIIDATLGISWHKVTVVEGGAAGADLLARTAAMMLEIAVETHPADWDEHGKAAGPIRNQEMVDAGADVCLAFFQPGAANRGTADCVSRAVRAGIPVRRYPEGGDREPRGDSPDSPAPGKPGLPGIGGQSVTIDFVPDDPGDLWDHILRVEPDEFIRASMSERFPAAAESRA